MQENTNKAIAYNTIVLYARLVINTICSLFITRYALNALGVDDFGLFSVLGSIISFISIFNTIMVSTSNRFISVSIGRGDLQDARDQFNINLLIHILIVIVTLLIALPIGDWYVFNYVNYEGNIETAALVLRISIIGAVISFIGVPYNGLLMAKEKFIVFCSADVASHILRLMVAYMITIMFTDKLIIYATALSALTALPTVVYIIYCSKHYKDIVSLKLVREPKKYKEVFSFSAWIAYGAFATVGKQQGAAILINMFFNTVMNTALGIANTVNGLICLVSHNVSQPIAPQITKSYAAGNTERSTNLLVMSTKLTYLAVLLISAPFFLGMEWIYMIWLGNIPEYVVLFSYLLIADSLISSLNSGISVLIFANGNIKLYQILINTLRLLSIVAAYLALKLGLPAYSLLYTYILFSVIVFFASQFVLRKSVNFNTSILWRKSYFPSLIVTALFLPSIFLKTLGIAPLIAICIGMLYLCFLIWGLGLTNSERKVVTDYFVLRCKLMY